MKPDLGHLGQVLDPPEREGDDGETSSRGTPSRNLEIRGLTSCWEPSVPPWYCSGPDPGQSALAFLDGNASPLETAGLTRTPLMVSSLTR